MITLTEEVFDDSHGDSDDEDINVTTRFCLIDVADNEDSVNEGV